MFFKTRHNTLHSCTYEILIVLKKNTTIVANTLFYECWIVFLLNLKLECRYKHLIIPNNKNIKSIGLYTDITIIVCDHN